MYQMNFARLKKCMMRAVAGESLNIGFIGGSITQGSLATKAQNTYAYQVFLWWKRTFPNAWFRYINAGIGGTSSHFGVSRAEEDLLQYQPDVVIVDFSVNDEANPFFQETFEGLIRKIYNWTTRPAVLILNNVFYDTGVNAQEFHNAVAAHYQIPYVSVKDTIYRRMLQGEFGREELTPDGLHPNDYGHKLISEEIILLLEQVKDQMWDSDSDVPMRKPLTPNAYEKAVRLNNWKSLPKLSGFQVHMEEKNGFLDHFKYGWIGEQEGASIIFKIKASCIAIQYRKTIRRPAVKAQAILDGNREHPILLDGNFDEDWGDCLYLEPILHHGEYRTHTVEIKVHEAVTKGDTPFYLMALITA